MKEISLDQAGIHPRILKWYNRIRSSNPGVLEAEVIIEGAIRSAGSNDFGEGWDPAALQILTKSINSEARLSPLGVFIVRKRLQTAVENRLRAQQYFLRYPEILEQELGEIWVVTGLQRTGTTYLQRLLSSDTEARPLYSWEGLDPVPHGRRSEVRARKRMARFSQVALSWMSPAFSAIHPVDYLRPEEDVLLLDQTLYTTAHEAMMHVPTFSSWLEKQDHTTAYNWERRLLKLLQWQRPGRRWILKSPHHLEWLHAMQEVFPKARFIWTHRDPRECIPSFMSMVFHGRAIFSESASKGEVAAHWLRKSRRMAMNGVEFCQGGGTVSHVNYYHLVSDYRSAIQELYSDLGAEMTDETMDRISLESDRHRQNRFGQHDYSASDFGLKRTDINAFMEGYLDQMHDEWQYEH